MKTRLALIPAGAETKLSEAERIAHNARVLYALPRADFIDDWITKTEGALPRGGRSRNQ